MELIANKSYKRQELKSFLSSCAICGMSDHLSRLSSVVNASVQTGRDSARCDRCHSDISFFYKMDEKNEVIDEYTLEYFKLGNAEYRPSSNSLSLYINNTYVKDIAGNLVDIDRCKKLMVIS